jgi:hypothetical protein
MGPTMDATKSPRMSGGISMGANSVTDDPQDSFTLPEGARQPGATFDRFGLVTDEGGGRSSKIYVHGLEFTAARRP